MNKKEILDKIKDLEGLNNDEKAFLINLVNTKKKYGLVWEDKPEDVEEELRTKLPVLKEVKERALVNDTETEHYPNHILIEGDNLHALTALTFTHEGTIDVIYIDPPYNTGNKDFIYNDAYVDKEDLYKHSKWLSFMEKRLKIAKRMLKPDGVIFISIDDNEQSQLKLLCDEIFGEINFISNIIWSAGKKNDSKYISNSHEYILTYFKNKEFITANKIRWKTKKEGIDKIYKTAAKFVKDSNGDFDAATVKLKQWFKELPENEPAKRHKHYSVIDENGVYFPDNISWPGGGGPRYEVLHPVTKKPVAIPSRGWVYSTIERMNEIIDQGKVDFGKDESYVPTLKSYLKDREYEVPYSVFYQDGRASTKRLREILGKNKFNNPKDENIIANLLSFCSSNSAQILDFFAGSGTTLHATMKQNDTDGGNRRCILVTNNENNIATEVTFERNRKIIQGYEIHKKVPQSVEGLNSNNLRYFKTDFVDREPSLANKRQLTLLATELLCIKEDCYKEITSEIASVKWHKLFSGANSHYVYIIYDDAFIEEAVELLKAFITQNPEAQIKVYVFSNGQYAYAEEFEEVAENIRLAALPDAIYKAYQYILPKQNKEFIPELEEETPVEFDNGIEA